MTMKETIINFIKDNPKKYTKSKVAALLSVSVNTINKVLSDNPELVELLHAERRVYDEKTKTIEEFILASNTPLSIEGIMSALDVSRNLVTKVINKDPNLFRKVDTTVSEANVDSWVIKITGRDPHKYTADQIVDIIGIKTHFVRSAVEQALHLLTVVHKLNESK